MAKDSASNCGKEKRTNFLRNGPSCCRSDSPWEWVGTCPSYCNPCGGKDCLPICCPKIGSECICGWKCIKYSCRPCPPRPRDCPPGSSSFQNKADPPVNNDKYNCDCD